MLAEAVGVLSSLNPVKSIAASINLNSDNKSPQNDVASLCKGNRFPLKYNKYAGK